jgi:hypothetical protein
MIGFIDTSHNTQLGTIGNTRTALSLFCTLSSSHALGFSVLTSRFLATDFSTVSLSLQITHEVFFHSLTHSLPLFCNCQFRRLGLIQFLIYRHAGVPKLDSSFSWLLLLVKVKVKLTLRLTDYCTDHVENTAYIVDQTCLPCCCPAIDVLLLQKLTRAEMCLPSRCLAVGLHITICMYIHKSVHSYIHTYTYRRPSIYDSNCS